MTNHSPPVRRNTRQRQAIEGLLDSQSEFRSAQQLYRLLKEQGSTIGQATVYRTLQTLQAEGEISVTRTETGELLYRRCEMDSHHHHLVCRECGDTKEIPPHGVEDWINDIINRYEFTQVSHEIELFGLCPKCSVTAS